MNPKFIKISDYRDVTFLSQYDISYYVSQYSVDAQFWWIGSDDEYRGYVEHMESLALNLIILTVELKTHIEGTTFSNINYLEKWKVDNMSEFDDPFIIYIIQCVITDLYELNRTTLKDNIREIPELMDKPYWLKWLIDKAVAKHLRAVSKYYYQSGLTLITKTCGVFQMHRMDY